MTAQAGRERRRRDPARARTRRFSGSRPTSDAALRQLDPRTLGRLIALYEHKVFIEGGDLGHQLVRPVGRRTRQGARVAPRPDRRRRGRGLERARPVDRGADRAYAKLAGEGVIPARPAVCVDSSLRGPAGTRRSRSPGRQDRTASGGMGRSRGGISTRRLVGPAGGGMGRKSKKRRVLHESTIRRNTRRRAKFTS